jgi:hypothetical protein
MTMICDAYAGAFVIAAEDERGVSRLLSRI